jgi:hypothetical protein
MLGEAARCGEEPSPAGGGTAGAAGHARPGSRHDAQRRGRPPQPARRLNETHETEPDITP